MRVALLCPGPSLAKLTSLPECDLSICVKRAALRFACDWVVILDSPALREFGAQIIGDPQLLTRSEYRPKYTRRGGLDLEALRCPHRFDQFTACAGLALAGHLGASHIDVYGADWTNEPDFDGHRPAEMFRDQARWDRERQDWEAIVSWLSPTPVHLHR